MKGDEAAMEIFELVKSGKRLPTKIEKLVPLSFIGKQAVNFYRATINNFEQLGMAQEQREKTLRDGQDAGDMLLDIEVKIGEIASNEPRACPTHGTGMPGSKPSGKPLKHERLGLKQNHMREAQMLASNEGREAIEKVKKEARQRDDIPSKTAAINEVRYQREKRRRKNLEKKPKSKALISIEEQQYIIALDRCINVLPQKPPKNWNADGLKEATAKAKIIIKRLEVFNE